MLRAIAALAVVLHHALEESNGAVGRFSPDWLTTSGAAGVDIFFVVSGFIMLHVSFANGRSRLSSGDFLFRRATRIYPLYWLCCLAMLSASGVGLLVHHHWNLTDIYRSFALVPDKNPIIGVSWTLVYEMYFYVIFGATLFLQSERATLLGVTACILASGAAGIMLHDGPIGAWLSNPIVLEFCFGLWLAAGLPNQRTRSSRLPPLLGLAGFGTLIAAPAIVAHATTHGLAGYSRVLAWGLPAVLVVQAFAWSGQPGNPLTRFLAWLGDASYALYLTHGFVMIGYAWLIKWTAIGQYNQCIFVLLAVLVSVTVALLTHVLVERPLLAMIRVYLRPLVLGLHVGRSQPSGVPHRPAS